VFLGRISKLGCISLLLLAVTVPAQPATQGWDLAADLGDSKTNPLNCWAFLYAPNPKDHGQNIDVDPAHYQTLPNRDFNPSAHRVMWYPEKGNAFSRPAIRISNIKEQLPRDVTMHTASDGDVMVCWTSPHDLTVHVTGSIQDQDANKGTGILRISRYTGSGLDEDVLQEVTITDNAAAPDTFSVTVKLKRGDQLFFRKTHYKLDDYGTTQSNIEINIQVTTTAAAQKPAADAPWHFYALSKGTYRLDALTLLPVLNNNGHCVASSAPDSQILPMATWDENQPQQTIKIRAEKDAGQPNNQGQMLAAWRVPATGNWDVKMHVANVGLGVFGGDGGKVTLTRWQPDEQYNTSYVDSAQIPFSSKDQQPSVTIHTVLKLSADDRLAFLFDAGIDGYGDAFVATLTATPTDKPGVDVPMRGVEGFLPLLPQTYAPKGAALREGLFWLGCDGRWATSAYAQEAITFFQQYVPQLAIVAVNSFPDRLKLPNFYRQLNIPTLIQTHGSGYEPYFKAKNAFEVNWQMQDMGIPRTGPLTGSSHASAKPHPAVRHAFANLTQAAIRKGYSGFGYHDMVWMWGGGRGRSGYNEQTIKAFRQALLGQDEGLMISLHGQPSRRIHFRDYAMYYIGGMPEPSAFGLASWADYSPMTKAAFDANPPTDVTPHDLLFDLLCSYQWLRLADYLGQTAQAEGGFFQCMPNPEDMANHCDFLFASALDSVAATSEEFFRSPKFMDAAYVRFHSLANRKRVGHQVGIVMETGPGGNEYPYYANQVSYAIAYELTLATQADHAEGDFWPGRRDAMQQVMTSSINRARAQQLLAYGLGFRHAREDQAQRIAPDFVSVTARRILRPWGQDYSPWSIKLDTPMSPDMLLAESGFSFSGIGEDSLESLDFPQKLLVYTPDIPTEQGWQRMVQLLEAGKASHAIVTAPALQEVITRAFNRRSLASLFPNMATHRVDAKASGRLQSNTQEAMGTFEIAGPLYQWDDANVVLSVGNQPIVMQKTMGLGVVNMLLFDPTEAANESLAKQVYQYLLGKLAIQSNWASRDGASIRLYQQGKTIIAGVQSAKAHDRHYFEQKIDGKCFLDYAVDNQTAFTLRLKANTQYNWVCLPSGGIGKTTADEIGGVHLQLPRTNYELFFLTPTDPADNARQVRLLKRQAQLSQALQINGYEAR
jgi:hypothetical protein